MLPAAHPLDGITAVLRPRVEGDRDCGTDLPGGVDEDLEDREVPQPGAHASTDHEAVVGANGGRSPRRLID